MRIRCQNNRGRGSKREFGPLYEKPIPGSFRLSIPIWILLTATALPTLYLWHRDGPYQLRLVRRGPGCFRCGYPRKGLPRGAACPECGEKPEDPNDPQ